MRHLKKVLAMVFMLAVLALVPGMQSFAASNIPENVKKLTAKASETTVDLKWGKVSKATGYEIYRVSGGTRKKLATTTKTSYTVKKLKVNQEYSFQVYAYRKVKGKTYRSASGSPIAAVKTYYLAPAVPAKFRIDTYGDLSMTLKWSKAANASGYYIYKYDAAAKAYKLLAKTTKTSYVVSGLKNGETVKFKIQGYRTVKGETIDGKLSDAISGKAKAESKAVKSVSGKRYSVTLKSDTTVTVNETKAKKKLKKGAKMVATSASGTNVTVILSDKNTAKIARSKLKYGNLSTTTKGYSKSVKEAFVNEKGYSSSTSYLIWVNQYTTTINIFKGSKGKWSLVRSSACIVGRMGKTPSGVYRICRRDVQYGAPRLFFTWNSKTGKGNSFHRMVDWHTRGAYSLGCVRLNDGDLYYIANNCPMGTTVVSY